MRNFFNESPTPETLIDRLAVIWNQAERQLNSELQIFEAQSRSELAREKFREHRQSEIAFTTRRNIQSTVSPETLRMILRDIDKKDTARIQVLSKTLDFLEPVN